MDPVIADQLLSVLSDHGCSDEEVRDACFRLEVSVDRMPSARAIVETIKLAKEEAKQAEAKEQYLAYMREMYGENYGLK